MQKRVLNLFAAVERGDDDEEGAAGDNEAKFTVLDIAFFICWESDPGTSGRYMTVTYPS